MLHIFSAYFDKFRIFSRIFCIRCAYFEEKSRYKPASINSVSTVKRTSEKVVNVVWLADKQAEIHAVDSARRRRQRRRPSRRIRCPDRRQSSACGTVLELFLRTQRHSDDEGSGDRQGSRSERSAKVLAELSATDLSFTRIEFTGWIHSILWVFCWRWETVQQGKRLVLNCLFSLHSLALQTFSDHL